MAATPAARPLAPPTSRPPRLAPREWPSAANTRASGGRFFFFFFLPVGRWGAVERAATQHTQKNTAAARPRGWARILAGRHAARGALRAGARAGSVPGVAYAPELRRRAKISTRKYPGRRLFLARFGCCWPGQGGGRAGTRCATRDAPARREASPGVASRRLDRDCARGVRPRRASPRRVRSADRGWGAAAWPWRVCFAPAERAAAQGSGRTPRDRAGSASGARRSERRAERGVA